MPVTQSYDVKDVSLAPEGLRRIQWADREMRIN